MVGPAAAENQVGLIKNLSWTVTGTTEQERTGGGGRGAGVTRPPIFLKF